MSLKEVQELIAGLIEHKAQIQKWTVDIERKIYELEETYIEETPNGNIVRGWELDQKNPNANRSRQIEDKERIFSCSSYLLWMDSKTIFPAESENRKNSNSRADHSANQPRQKKTRKSSSSKRDLFVWDD